MLQNQWTPKKWLINADLIKEDQRRKGMEREGRKNYFTRNTQTKK